MLKTHLTVFCSSRTFTFSFCRVNSPGSSSPLRLLFLPRGQRRGGHVLLREAVRAPSGSACDGTAHHAALRPPARRSRRPLPGAGRARPGGGASAHRRRQRRCWLARRAPAGRRRGTGAGSARSGFTPAQPRVFSGHPLLWTATGFLVEDHLQEGGRGQM